MTICCAQAAQTLWGILLFAAQHCGGRLSGFGAQLSHIAFTNLLLSTLGTTCFLTKTQSNLQNETAAHKQAKGKQIQELENWGRGRGLFCKVENLSNFAYCLFIQTQALKFSNVKILKAGSDFLPSPLAQPISKTHLHGLLQPVHVYIKKHKSVTIYGAEYLFFLLQRNTTDAFWDGLPLKNSLTALSPPLLFPPADRDHSSGRKLRFST